MGSRKKSNCEKIREAFHKHGLEADEETIANEVGFLPQISAGRNFTGPVAWRDINAVRWALRKSSLSVTCYEDGDATCAESPLPADEEKNFWRNDFASVALLGFLSGRTVGAATLDRERVCLDAFAWADSMILASMAK